MNIVLVTDDFYPNLGGIAHTLMNLYNGFRDKEHILYIFNPYSKGPRLFNIVNTKDYILKDLAFFLRHRKFYYFIIYSFWKIVIDKRTPVSHRLKTILYLIGKPKILMKVIYNVNCLFPYLKKLKFDIVVGSHSGWILPLVFILSRIFNKKLVSMAHGNDFLIRNPLTLKTFYFRNVDKIILSNNFMKDLIKKIHHLEENKLVVINRELNLTEFEISKSKNELRKEFNIPENLFVLLSVGRHVPRKDFDLVIRAVSTIKRAYPSLKLKYFLIGEGPETENLKKLTKFLNVEEEVEFLGPCDAIKRNKFYKLSDIFLMPVKPINYDIEGFGIVFLEANYYKIPVISTLTGGVVEAIINGETGFLTKINDLKGLVEKIIFLYQHEEKRIEMGIKGHNRVLREFTKDKIINDYIRVFENLIKN